MTLLKISVLKLFFWGKKCLPTLSTILPTSVTGDKRSLALARAGTSAPQSSTQRPHPPIETTPLPCPPSPHPHSSLTVCLGERKAHSALGNHHFSDLRAFLLRVVTLPQWLPSSLPRLGAPWRWCPCPRGDGGWDQVRTFPSLSALQATSQVLLQLPDSQASLDMPPS